MKAQLLSGVPIAEKVLKSVKREVEDLRSRGIIPGLGTILVGEDSASAGYVRKKHETCNEITDHHPLHPKGDGFHHHGNQTCQGEGYFPSKKLIDFRL